MKIIINADDLGMSEEINDAIFNLMDQGLISSSSIIANGRAVEHAAKKTKNYIKCSFGIHLNVTDLYPLSSTNMLSDILNEKGLFVGQQRLREIYITPSLSNAIYSEFCAQVEKLISLGIKISHIDSHEHIHTIPRLFFILKRIQKKYSIRRARISKNIFWPNDSRSKMLIFKKKIYNFLLRNYYKTKTTSGFCNIVEFNENAKLDNLKHKSIEIMVHPGTDKFKNEFDIFKNIFIHKKVKIHFSMITYDQL